MKIQNLRLARIVGSVNGSLRNFINRLMNDILFAKFVGKRSY